MLLSLLLWTTALQDRPVTLELRAARLENAVPILAEKTGLELEVDHEIKDLVVIVKVKERPAKSLLRLIGEQVNARWLEQDDGSLLLKRLPEDVAVQQAQQKALERQGIEAIKKRLREEIGDGAFTVKDVEKFIAELERINKPPENGQGMSLDGPRLAAPASMLAKQLILTIPTNELLEIRHGQSKTLTEAPVGPQHKASPLTLDAFDQFWRNLKLFVDYKAALLGNSRGSVIDKQVVNLEMPATGRGKTLAALSRSNNTLSAWVRVYCGNGDQLTEGFTLGESLLPAWKVPAALMAVKRTRFAMSPDTALIEAFNGGKLQLDGEFAKESREARLLDLLRDPEHKDLLGYVVTDAFFAWADELELDLVACVPAHFGRPAFLESQTGEFDLTKLWSLLERGRAMRVDSRDGAMLVRCVSSDSFFLDAGYAERLGRLNRGLAKFEDRMDACAQYASETLQATGRTGWGQWDLMAWDKAGLIPKDWHQEGMSFLAFWHRLPRTFQRSLHDGASFSISDLPSGARRDLDDLIGLWS
jgi:hypothetical protein